MNGYFKKNSWNTLEINPYIGLSGNISADVGAL